jgi:hypothetical protein
LVGFSESTENMAQVIGKIANGIDFILYGTWTQYFELGLAFCSDMTTETVR